MSEKRVNKTPFNEDIGESESKKKNKKNKLQENEDEERSHKKSKKEKKEKKIKEIKEKESLKEAEQNETFENNNKNEETETGFEKIESEVHTANNWEEADLGNDQRKLKFLKLMGAFKHKSEKDVPHKHSRGSNCSLKI